MGSNSEYKGCSGCNAANYANYKGHSEIVSFLTKEIIKRNQIKKTE